MRSSIKTTQTTHHQAVAIKCLTPNRIKIKLLKGNNIKKISGRFI